VEFGLVALLGQQDLEILWLLPFIFAHIKQTSCKALLNEQIDNSPLAAAELDPRLESWINSISCEHKIGFCNLFCKKYSFPRDF